MRRVLMKLLTFTFSSYFTFYALALTIPRAQIISVEEHDPFYPYEDLLEDDFSDRAHYDSLLRRLNYHEITSKDFLKEIIKYHWVNRLGKTKRKNIASLHKVIENVTDALDIIQSSYQDSQNFIQDFDPNFYESSLRVVSISKIEAIRAVRSLSSRSHLNFVARQTFWDTFEKNYFAL